MAKVTFDDLLAVYQNTAFDAEGRGGALTIASAEILLFLMTLEHDDDAAATAGVSVLAEASTLAVGKIVQIRVDAPRLGTGLFLKDFDSLLSAPECRIAEPPTYFIVSGRIHKNATPEPDLLAKYRLVLRAVGILGECAAYLDKTRQEMVFFVDGKFTVPVNYTSKDILSVTADDIRSFEKLVESDLHKDQKYSLLTTAIKSISEQRPANGRFKFLLENFQL